MRASKPDMVQLPNFQPSNKSISWLDGNGRIMAIAVSFLFLFLVSKGQPEWNLKMDKEGIKIYTGSIVHSKIRALRVECVLEARISQVAAALLDINTQDRWFYNTKSTLLQQVSPSELIYYAEVKLPWPFSNRDFAAHVKAWQNPFTKEVVIDVVNLPDFVPLKSNLVRVTESFARWVISPMATGMVKVEFTLFADPAGNIPSWLVNMFSTYGPYETFQKLRSYLRSTDYINAIPSFVLE